VSACCGSPPQRRGLCSADAIHLATDLRLDAHDLVADDAEMQVAARKAGLRVTAPR